MRINPVECEHIEGGTFVASEEDIYLSGKKNCDCFIVSAEELDYLLDKIHELESKIEELKYGN